MVVVISGPSGVGKTVICDRLVEEDPRLVPSISATTRPPRGMEKDGEDYFFWSKERFRSGIDSNYFLEWAEVHGLLYGTPRTPIGSFLKQGRCPILDVDVQGGRSVKTLMPDAVLILVAPASMEVLEKRLRGRESDSDEVLKKRLANATKELAQWRHYDYVVINDDLDQAVSEARSVIAAERVSVARRKSPPPPP